MWDRFHQALLLVSSLLLSWIGMMALHLVGHLIYAVLSDAVVNAVELQPWSFAAEPKIFHNPRPLLVAWGGPIWGCALPILLLWVIRAVAPQWSYLATFFAGFCLIANGSHLAVGSFLTIGDAKTLMWLGAPQWTLIAFGFPVMIAGIGLFHGLGAHFGMGPAGGRVNRRHAWLVTAAWIGLAAVLMVMHWRHMV